MTHHVHVPFGAGELGITQLPENSYIVRFHPKTGEPYDRLNVVSQDGDELELMGFVGKPFGLRLWHAAKAAVFPRAKKVRFERRLENGTLRAATFDI